MTRAPMGMLLLSGVRHQRGYVPYFVAHPRLRLVAVADEPGLPDWMDAANVSLAAELDIPYVRDVDAALARSDVSVVSVCSEPVRHAELARSALAAGKHVLVDKPAALTADECTLLAASMATGGGTPSFTFVHRLFSPSVQRLRALIDAGRLGLPWAVHVTWLTAGGLGGAAVEHDALVADPRLSGGGELANFLGYPVGYIRYLTGLEVTSVFATTATHTLAPHQLFGVEDFGVVSLALERGVLASVTVGRLADGAAPGPGVFTMRVHGSHASAMVDEYRPRVQVFSSGHSREWYGGEGAGGDALRLLIDDFVAAIDEGRRPLCGVDDARALTAVLRAAYTSAATGVKVPA
jgi:myo-inositol 2-dehydrogenase/D-chiro-inositol 1-dehydrogenase